MLEAEDAKGKGELLGKIWKLDVEERLKYHEDQKRMVHNWTIILL